MPGRRHVEGWKREIGLFFGTMRNCPSPARQEGFQRGEDAGDAFGPDDEVPDRLELLPGRRVAEVADSVDRPGVVRRPLPERAPAVEVSVGGPVSLLQLVPLHALRLQA